MIKIVNYELLGVRAGISAWNDTPVFVGWKIRTYFQLFVPSVVLRLLLL